MTGEKAHAQYADDNRICAGEVISERVLHQAGVFITPGFIFGKNGENYIRVSLCATTEVLEAAERRIRDNIQSIKKI